MTGKNTTTTQLIFGGECFVSLPKVAQILRTRLTVADGTDVTETEASLTSLVLEQGALRVTLDLGFVQDETVLSVRIGSTAEEETAALQMRLAPLAYALAAELPAKQVIWAGTDLRIPRDTFVQGLAGQFAAAQPELPEPPAQMSHDTPSATSATVTPIAPRRVAAPATTTRARMGRSEAQLAAILPAIDKTTAIRPANINLLPADNHYDAHVLAYENALRAMMLRDASDEELALAASERGPIPVEVRLSTWAVSLSVATVALPVAIPVMAYNVVRGEDMRVASLAMALAGFFLTLNASGAIAGVAGF